MYKILLGMMVSVGATVLLASTAFAAANDYTVSGGEATLPVVGAASATINTITLTDVGGDDFSDIDATEIFVITLNQASFPSVQFDQTVVAGGIGVAGAGNSCGHTSASALTFTDAYTANVTVTGAGGAGPATKCAAGEIITISGLKVKTMYAATIGATAKLVSVDNSVTALGSTVASSTTMAQAISAAALEATVTFGDNATVGATGVTTITIVSGLPFAMDANDTIDITFPDYVDITGASEIATGTFDDAGATITCDDSGQVLTCTATGGVTATTGTIILQNITTSYIGTTNVTVFEVEDEGVAANDTATDTAVALTDVTAASANATVALGTNSVVGDAGSVTITVNVPFALDPDDTIDITFPAFIDLTGDAVVATGTFDDPGATITCDDSAQVLTCTVSVGATATTGTIIVTGITSSYVGETDITVFEVENEGVAANDIATDTEVGLTNTTVGDLSAGTLSVSDMTASQYNVHTITFTTTTTIPNLGKIVISYPSAWNVTGVNSVRATALSGLDGTWTATVSSQNVTLTQTGGTATTAGAKSLQLQGGIQTPTTPGAVSGTMTITTTTAADANIETKASISTGTVQPRSNSSSWDSNTTTTTTTPATDTTTTPATDTTTPDTTTPATDATEDTGETPAAEEVTPAATTTVTFSDVEGHWSEVKVEAMSEKGIIEGDKEGDFNPNGKLNRAEATALLFRVTGQEEPSLAPTTKSFDDVALDSWYAAYVDYLKGLDLISGKTATKFAPAENMNRAEFLVLAMRVYHHMTGTTTPTAQVLTTKFADKLPTWAEMTISEAADLGFVSGTEKDGKTYFNPSAQITRAEAATILYNMFFGMLK